LKNINGNRKSSKQVNLKSSSINLLLNISIFVLAAVIVYMGYSIFIKLTNDSDRLIEESSGQAASDIIQAEVLNGCGVSGVADRFTDFMRTNKFDVVKSDNYITDDVSESLVIDRSGNMANAYKTAKALGIKNENVIQQLNRDYFLDVSVVIGRDYFNLTPFK